MKCTNNLYVYELVWSSLESQTASRGNQITIQYIHDETSLPIEVLNLADDHLLKVLHHFCDEAFADLQKQG